VIGLLHLGREVLGDMDLQHPPVELIYDKVLAGNELVTALHEFQGGEHLRCYVCGENIPDWGDNLGTYIHYGSHGLTDVELYNGVNPTMRLGCVVERPDMGNLVFGYAIEPALSLADQCVAYRGDWRCGVRVDRNVSYRECLIHADVRLEPRSAAAPGLEVED